MADAMPKPKPTIANTIAVPGQYDSMAMRISSCNSVSVILICPSHACARLERRAASLPRCPHLVDKSDGAFDEHLRRVLVAPVAHPQIHPGGVAPCNLLLL